MQIHDLYTAWVLKNWDYCLKELQTENNINILICTNFRAFAQINSLMREIKYKNYAQNVSREN